MAIKFKCPNAACGMVLTVKDEAAGRKGKCPTCGSVVVVPQLQTVSAGDSEGYDLGDSGKPEPVVSPPPVSRSSSNVPRPTGEPYRPPSPVGGSVYDGEVGDGLKSAGPAVRFSAIGLGMSLLGKNFWTWVLASLLGGFAMGGVNVAISVLGIPVQMIMTPVVGAQSAIGAIGLMQMIAMMALLGVVWGGFYRMALRQLDGYQISVSDMFAITNLALKLVLVFVLTGIIVWIGSVMFILPGLVAAGLLMFALPLVVDGGLAPIDSAENQLRNLET